MSNTDLIKELRVLTQAGMKDCKEALEEANWNLQQAVDIVKTKGLNIADGRSGRVAADGVVLITNCNVVAAMMEVNCQTDFVANSDAFQAFATRALGALCNAWNTHTEFSVNDVETARKELVAITKENIVVRRWWQEEAMSPNVRVFSYLHSNRKLGVLLTLQAPSMEALQDPRFHALGEDLAMQVCAMNPLALSPEHLLPGDVDRQKLIFQTQLDEMVKKPPQAALNKIMEGKIRKWHSEVCLSEQESVVQPKTAIKEVIRNLGVLLGGEITVVNFIRCQVGEGLDKKQDNFTEEVAKLM